MIIQKLQAFYEAQKDDYNKSIKPQSKSKRNQTKKQKVTGSVKSFCKALVQNT